MRISDWSSACALPIYRLRLHQAGRADRGDDPGKLGPTVRHPADLCGPCVDQFLELPWKEALRSVADGGVDVPAEARVPAALGDAVVDELLADVGQERMELDRVGTLHLAAALQQGPQWDLNPHRNVQRRRSEERRGGKEGDR